MPGRLVSESSPYLRQHADNPVDWYPWSEEAFEQARLRDVPILLSVGYSACHWCHVMAHESFEDPAIARQMNEYFVCVKVDREERPDVDALYMDAVQALTGRGGWPMTVFLTPLGEPFFGGTYFPREGFARLMTGITDVWLNRRDDVLTNAAALVEALSRTARVQPDPELPGLDVIDALIDDILESFDPEWGGFGSAPKFPSTMNLELVLRRHLRRPDERLREVLTTSLDAMCSGGMYDHLGGGFARYSVDRKFLVPHFEKMLYDQALLVEVYTHAWQIFGSETWKQVVRETVSYVLSDLRSPVGGLYSSRDADSLDSHGHSVEGAFYTWTPEEVAAVCDAGDEVAAWFGITEEGNFEGRSIPNRLNHRSRLQRTAEMEDARERLLRARTTRPAPGLDTKILTEWNALMIVALCEASRAFDEPEWLEAAEQCANFLHENVRDASGEWMRSWEATGSPQARHRAVASDHAALLLAFVRLAETSGRSHWIDKALDLADRFIEQFWDVDHGGFFNSSTSRDELITRQKDLLDNATPGANSTAAMALLKLGTLTGHTRLIDAARATARLLVPVARRAPSGSGRALAVLESFALGLTEVALCGTDDAIDAVVDSTWRPNVVVARGERYDSPLWSDRRDGFAYVCRHYTCEAPTEDANELSRLLADIH